MTDFSIAPPKHKGIGCTTAWHLFRSGKYLAVYSLIGTLTKGGKTDFFVTISNTGKYFYGPKMTPGQYEVMRRIFKGLRAQGWIELLIVNDVASQHYRWIHHDEWKAARADSNGDCDQCTKRELLPWQETADPLVGKLWALSGGKLRAYENMVRQLKPLASDEKILARYYQALAEVPARRKAGIYTDNSARGSLWRVIKDLKTEATLG